VMLVSSTVCALRGYSHLETDQAVHQHHARHVAIYLLLYHICMFSHCPRTSGSASRNAKSTLTVTTCVLAFSPLESLPSFRSHTPVQTSSCHPGCPSESMQRGFNSLSIRQTSTHAKKATSNDNIIALMLCS